MNTAAHDKHVFSPIFRRIGAALGIAMVFPFASLVRAAPPDLTNGGVPGDNMTINLGPTGMRGWVYHVSHKTAESRQILVTAVATGSPALTAAAGGYTENDATNSGSIVASVLGRACDEILEENWVRPERLEPDGSADPDEKEMH